MNATTRPWCAFVHTDRRQRLAALVAAYSLKARGGGGDGFNVRMLTVDGTVLDGRNDGRLPRNDPRGAWDHTHPAAFQFLRRSIPEQMNYRGRAVVIDPDIFATGSLCPLFESDMQGTSVLARFIDTGYLGEGDPYYATSVMLMDCAKLTHWSMPSELEGYFAGRYKYWDLVQLGTEPPATVGPLDEKWNSLDTLTPGTRLLHFTRPSTQPWMTGLPMDDRIFEPTYPHRRPPGSPGQQARSTKRYYRENPDPAQCAVFFELLGECIAGGLIDPDWIEAEIAQGRVRPDLFEVLGRHGYRPGKPQSLTLEKEYFGAA